MLKTVVLAAGKGSRLKSKTPKVLQPIFDKPLLAWVLDSLAEVEQDEIIVVAGYKAREVSSFLHAYPVTTVIQEPQLGTGHALQCVSEQVQSLRDFDGTILILSGDSPLISSETINELLEFHQSVNADLTLLTAEVKRPRGYGRIIRKGENVIGIMEEKDCSEAERAIREINSGVYCLNWQTMREGLRSLRNDNAQEEFYLTDLVGWAYKRGLQISSYELDNNDEIMGVNTRADLAQVIQKKNQKQLARLMKAGVTIVDPISTFISPDVEIGRDTIVFPGTYIHRRVTIGEACSIGPYTSIYGPAEIGSGTTVMHSHVFRSTIGENCTIGPFAHIRDGNDIGSNVKLGSFVEVKNCEISDNVMASHLSYLGDSKIKSHVNIGAGTVTANYDSRTGEKHQTIIRSRASTGANSVLVAPIELGENAMVAAGSVITDDVPADSLAIARPRQETKSMQKS